METISKSAWGSILPCGSWQQVMVSITLSRWSGYLTLLTLSDNWCLSISLAVRSDTVLRISTLLRLSSHNSTQTLSTLNLFWKYNSQSDWQILEFKQIHIQASATLGWQFWACVSTPIIMFLDHLYVMLLYTDIWLVNKWWFYIMHEDYKKHLPILKQHKRMMLADVM